MLIPAASNVHTESGSSSRGAYSTQSGFSASTSSRSVVARTPRGARPHNSPASRPALAALCTRTPTTSRRGCSTAARRVRLPMFPVAHCTTRYAAVLFGSLMTRTLLSLRENGNAACVRGPRGRCVVGIRFPALGQGRAGQDIGAVGEEGGGQVGMADQRGHRGAGRPGVAHAAGEERGEYLAGAVVLHWSSGSGERRGGVRTPSSRFV